MYHGTRWLSSSPCPLAKCSRGPPTGPSLSAATDGRGEPGTLSPVDCPQAPATCTWSVVQERPCPLTPPSCSPSHPAPGRTPLHRQLRPWPVAAGRQRRGDAVPLPLLLLESVQLARLVAGRDGGGQRAAQPRDAVRGQGTRRPRAGQQGVLLEACRVDGGQLRAVGLPAGAHTGRRACMHDGANLFTPMVGRCPTLRGGLTQ